MKNKSLLCCPNCGKKLIRIKGCYRCEGGHSFDVAKAGYVNLLLSNKKTSADPGDNKEMIAARRLVMDGGYCAPLFKAMADYLTKNGVVIGSLVDAGSGEGFFAESFARLYPDAEIVGVDISKHAATAAARASDDAEFVVASSKNLPVADGAADAVFCAFAPLFANEVLRVLKQNGYFIHIIPNAKHLFELKERLYDNVLLNDVPSAEIEGLELHGELTVDYDFTATGDTLAALIKMTPYYYRTDLERVKRVVSDGCLTTSLHFLARIYRKI